MRATALDRAQAKDRPTRTGGQPMTIGEITPVLRQAAFDWIYPDHEELSPVLRAPQHLFSRAFPNMALSRRTDFGSFWWCSSRRMLVLSGAR